MKTNYERVVRYTLYVIRPAYLFIASLLLFIGIAGEALAQPTNRINYQAVARNTSGNELVNQNISVRLSILNGSGGPSLYTETFNLSTNNFGLFTVQIGGGVLVSGNYNTINWSAGNQWLKVEMDPTGGSSYVNMGESQLLSVPYALFAASSSQWSSNGTDISNANSGNVGIGTTSPGAKLHLVSSGNLPLVIDGAPSMYVGLYEGGIYRGYFGSYSGIAEDVDLGTGTGNTTGSLHLTIEGNPVLTVDENENVGIGTTSPNTGSKLEVNGASILVDAPGTRFYEIRRGGAHRWAIREAATTGMEFYQIYNDGGTLINNVRLAIADSGNIGVGTASPDLNSKVQVIESDVSAMTLGTVNGALSYLTVNKPTTSNATEIVRVRDNGATVATFHEVADTYQLTVFGDALASGGTWINSDRNIKRDIGVIDNALSSLMALNPSVYYFDNKNENFRYLNLPEELQFGLLAQDVKKVFPNIVREAEQYDEGGNPRPMKLHSVNYTALIPVLIKGMQEQQKMIEELKAEVKTLKSGQTGKK